MKRVTAASLKDALDLLASCRHEEAEAEQSVRELLLAAITPALQPGTILEDRDPRFGRIGIVHGNARGARRFEVCGAPSIRDIPSHPCLTRVVLDAYPLNDAGKRMSGRTARGHTEEHVRISFQVGIDHGPDDKRTSEQILVDTIAKWQAG